MNGSLLTGCGVDSSGKPTEALNLLDTQIGFDPALGLWIATQLAQASQGNTDQVYLAVSDTSDATGTWEKWSLPVCNTDPSSPLADQPLLGWSATVGTTPGIVTIDVTCGTNVSGADNLILIPNSMITSHAKMLPAAIAAPCSNMTPARDETKDFANQYLIASIVPSDNGATGNLSTCAPNAGNTEPYIIEYTATTNGTTATVSGSSGACAAGKSCSPVSTSFQDGVPATYILTNNPAQQMIAQPYTGVCPTTAPKTCEIDLGNARITAAQIRASNNGSGANLPVLTAGFNYGTMTPGPGMANSQNVWFLQNLGQGTGPGDWVGTVDVSDPINGWVAYPTIALDNDQDFYYSWTTFGPNIFPTTSWSGITGYLSSSPLGLGSGTLESSSSTYTGQAGDSRFTAAGGPQRWGDYNTMVYDPSEIGPGGEPGFWQIEEISQGGADQSTNWWALGDPTPLPYFFKSTNKEDELCEGGGNPCTITVNAPAGTQGGDLVLVALSLFEPAANLPKLPDSSWTLLSASNITGTPQQLSASDSNNGSSTVTTWVAAHIFGPGDSGSYDFTHFVML